MAAYSGTWSAGTPHRGGFLRWIVSTALLLILIAIFSSISQLQQPGSVNCPSNSCPIPPPRPGRLSASHRYTSSRYGFSLDYSTANIKPSHVTSASIAWDGTLSDGSEVAWSFTGVPATGRSPEQIVSAAQSNNFSDAQQAYTIPDAGIGYTGGFGNVYDVNISTGSGSEVHDRLVIVAAVRGGLAVVMVGLGPYKRTSPSSDSQPNPADTPLVELGDFEENIGSVTFPGQPPW